MRLLGDMLFSGAPLLLGPRIGYDLVIIATFIEIEHYKQWFLSKTVWTDFKFRNVAAQIWRIRCTDEFSKALSFFFATRQSWAKLEKRSLFENTIPLPMQNTLNIDVSCPRIWYLPTKMLYPTVKHWDNHECIRINWQKIIHVNIRASVDQLMNTVTWYR